jgi:hypothetical protein
MVDGAGLARPDSPGRLSVPLLVVVAKEMRVLDRMPMPSLGGATGWLTSEPLGPAELRGHDFNAIGAAPWIGVRTCIGYFSGPSHINSI